VVFRVFVQFLNRLVGDLGVPWLSVAFRGMLVILDLGAILETRARQVLLGILEILGLHLVG
jgi:hypothetical protein